MSNKSGIFLHPHNATTGSSDSEPSSATKRSSTFGEAAAGVKAAVTTKPKTTMQWATLIGLIVYVIATILLVLMIVLSRSNYLGAAAAALSRYSSSSFGFLFKIDALPFAVVGILMALSATVCSLTAMYQIDASHKIAHIVITVISVLVAITSALTVILMAFNTSPVALAALFIVICVMSLALVASSVAFTVLSKDKSGSLSITSIVAAIIGIVTSVLAVLGGSALVSSVKVGKYSYPSKHIVIDCTHLNAAKCEIQIGSAPVITLPVTTHGGNVIIKYKTMIPTPDVAPTEGARSTHSDSLVKAAGDETIGADALYVSLPVVANDSGEWIPDKTQLLCLFEIVNGATFEYKFKFAM